MSTLIICPSCRQPLDANDCCTSESCVADGKAFLARFAADRGCDECGCRHGYHATDCGLYRADFVGLIDSR